MSIVPGKNVTSLLPWTNRRKKINFLFTNIYSKPSISSNFSVFSWKCLFSFTNWVQKYTWTSEWGIDPQYLPHPWAHVTSIELIINWTLFHSLFLNGSIISNDQKSTYLKPVTSNYLKQINLKIMKDLECNKNYNRKTTVFKHHKNNWLNVEILFFALSYTKAKL